MAAFQYVIVCLSILAANSAGADSIEEGSGLSLDGDVESVHGGSIESRRGDSTESLGSGLTKVMGHVKSRSGRFRLSGGGTDNSVKIELLGGLNDLGCTTEYLNDWRDNWSAGDTEEYTQHFGDCETFQTNGKEFRFRMIVNGSDKLCLKKMEFIVNEEKYVWKEDDDDDDCWENLDGPIKVAKTV